MASLAMAGITFATPAALAQKDTTRNDAIATIVWQVDWLNWQRTDVTPPTAVTGLKDLLVGEIPQRDQIIGFNGQTTTMEGADATTAPNGWKIKGFDGSYVTK